MTLVLQKINLTVTQEEYQLILDSLELMESRVAAKMAKTVNQEKRSTMRKLNLDIQELLTDLAEYEI